MTAPLFTFAPSTMSFCRPLPFIHPFRPLPLCVSFLVLSLLAPPSRLLRNQQRFKEIDEELNAELGDLDHQVAEVTNAALARFVQLQAGYAGGLLHCYGNAMAAIPGTLPAAPASLLPPAEAVAAAGGVSRTSPLRWGGRRPTFARRRGRCAFAPLAATVTTGARHRAGRIVVVGILI